MTSSQRLPTFPSWKSLLTLFSCVLQSDMWELIEGYGQRWTILRWKLERSLLRVCIGMCECNSQRSTFLFSVQCANKFSGNLQWDTYERNEAYGDKGNILRWKLEKSFLEISWWCVNSSHRVTFMFPATVHYHCFWGTCESFLLIALRPTLIKEISSVQNVKKCSEKLPSDLWIHLTELHFRPQEAVC